MQFSPTREKTNEGQLRQRGPYCFSLSLSLLILISYLEFSSAIDTCRVSSYCSLENTIDLVFEKSLRRQFTIRRSPTSRNQMAAPIPSPAESAENILTPNILSSLPAEIQILIAEDLDIKDLCAVRASSRSLACSFVAPNAWLIKELARAWCELDRAFGWRYDVDYLVTLTDPVRKQVTLHVASCGFSPTISKWLIDPLLHQFPCSSCHRVKPFEQFPSDDLRDLFPFRVDAFEVITRAVYKEALSNLTCGKCEAESTSRYVYLGFGDFESCTIKCEGCLEVYVAREVSTAVSRSRFCPDCFWRINSDWSKYKSYLRRYKSSLRKCASYLQDCLRRMEEHEDGQSLIPPPGGFLRCPGTPGFAEALSSEHHRGLSTSTFALELSTERARMRCREIFGPEIDTGENISADITTEEHLLVQEMAEANFNRWNSCFEETRARKAGR